MYNQFFLKTVKALSSLDISQTVAWHMLECIAPPHNHPPSVFWAIRPVGETSLYQTRRVGSGEHPHLSPQGHADVQHCASYANVTASAGTCHRRGHGHRSPAPRAVSPLTTCCPPAPGRRTARRCPDVRVPGRGKSWADGGGGDLCTV